MNKFISMVVASTLLAAGAAWAQAGSNTMTDGEVRKVDKETKKITLKHGEIKNLDMPAMTMVFKVQNAALLDKVQVGDKVRFTVEKGEGGYVVTSLEAAK